MLSVLKFVLKSIRFFFSILWFSIKFGMRATRKRGGFFIYYVIWCFTPIAAIKTFFCIFLQQTAHEATLDAAAIFYFFSFMVFYLYIISGEPATDDEVLATYLWAYNLSRKASYKEVKNSLELRWLLFSLRHPWIQLPEFKSKSKYKELPEQQTQLKLEHKKDTNLLTHTNDINLLSDESNKE